MRAWHLLVPRWPHYLSEVPRTGPLYIPDASRDQDKFVESLLSHCVHIVPCTIFGAPCPEHRPCISSKKNCSGIWSPNSAKAIKSQANCPNLLLCCSPLPIWTLTTLARNTSCMCLGVLIACKQHLQHLRS